MANVKLQPPEPFNFQTPDEEPCWCRCFEQFRKALSLSIESEECQVNTLLYCLSVLKPFDDFFKVRHNVIFERAYFIRWNQKEGESCKQYIAKVYTLAEHC